MELHELLKEFKTNGINTDTLSNRHKHVLAFQDCIGHMSFDNIFDTFSDLDKNERGNFLWVSCTCLDKDTFLEIIKKVVCQSVIIEEENRLSDMYKDKLSAIIEREHNMVRLEQDNAVNVEKIRTLELDLEYKIKDNKELRIKSQSFDTIKRLLIA